MRHVRNKVISVAAGIAMTVMVLQAQAPPTPKLSFDVASVKQSPPDARIFRFGSSGGRFFATRTTLQTLLQLAYAPQDGTGFGGSRIIGAPGWVDVDRFDVEAKTEEATAGPIPREKLQPMLQSLLEDRFQLKAHREIREFPVYLLTVAKGGAKLKLSEDQNEQYSNQPSTTPIERRRGIMRTTEDGMVANAVRLRTLTSFLSGRTGRTVLDKTGLEGIFDFTLHWTPRAPVASSAAAAGPEAPPTASDPAGASIFTAVQELGLKLEAAKAPLEVLIIDSVQKPSQN